MSHHYSGPNIGFPRDDARLDLTDLYAFPKPETPQVDVHYECSSIRRP
jgi:hypothetical protein